MKTNKFNRKFILAIVIILFMNTITISTIKADNNKDVTDESTVREEQTKLSEIRQTVETIDNSKNSDVIHSSEKNSTDNTVTNSTIKTDESTIAEETKQPAETIYNSVAQTSEKNSIEKKVKKEQNNTKAATSISTWEQLVTAYANEAITSVSLSNDIVKGTGNLATGRKTSFSIEGNNHSLDLGNQVFRVQQSATATFSISDIQTLTTTAGNVTGIVSSGDANTAKSGWTINMTNVNSSLENKTRIASVSGAQLNLAGDIKWYTASEMAVIDGVKIADNAKVMSIKQKQHEDRSFFWFAQASMDPASAGSHNFVIGKNAVANFKMTGSGTAFPVVFAYYNELRLESGATYNATMPGNAFRSDYYKSSFVAEGNNKVNLTSLNAGYATVAFNSNSKPQEESQFYIGPESEFYIIGATNQKLFTGNATDKARTKITIDSPKNYDMRNSSTANNANSSIADIGFKEFTIKNSDVNIWSLDSNVAGPASYSTSTIDYVTQIAGGSVTSSDSLLQSQFKTEGLRRISGLNQDPEFNFKDITNAEYSISGKVILGYVPDENGMDDEGNINYIPVYPGKDQASIALKDSFGELHTNLKTDANGDVTYKGEKLNKENEIVQATATYGNHNQKEVSEYKVVDITPPEPTKLKTQNVSANTRKLEGTGEIGATVYLRLNGNLIDSVTTQVDGEGNWSMDIPENTFIKDMEGQLFLEDTAGKANIEAPPITNSANGNINPITALKYKDVTFEAGTKFTVLKENKIPEIKIGIPVETGGTYEYFPENHEDLGGVLEIVANVKDVDSKTFTTYLQVDGGKAESLGTKAGGSDIYRDITKEYQKEEIQEILADNEPHVFTFYAEDSDGGQSEKVSITIVWPNKGELAMTSVPDVSFGDHDVNKVDKTFYVESKEKDLVIEDTRKDATSWKVNAQIEKELTNADTDKEVTDVLRYDDEFLSVDKMTIYEKSTPEKGSFNLSENWIDKKEGLNLFVKVGKIGSGNYNASIMWSLEETPPNEN